MTHHLTAAPVCTPSRYDQGVVKGGSGPPTFLEQRKESLVAFSTNAQSRFVSVVLDCVLRLCPCIFVVLEAMHEASQGPLKGLVSAQKAFQGCETETRELLGGTEENSVSPTRDQANQ